MATKLKEIEIINESIANKPISAESIASEFFGITTIQYVPNKINNNIIVMVYTLNVGSIHIEDLVKIQKKLKANSMSISYTLESGLVYILTY